MRSRVLATLLVVVALVASAAVGGWVHAQTTSRQTAGLTAQDHFEITQLYARFNQGSDFRNASLWLSTFADDAVFTLPSGQEIAGKQALTAWRARSFGGKVGDSKRRHLHGSIQLSPTPNGGAKARAYWVVLDVSEKQPALASTGYVDDVFVRTAEGWRFKTHTVHSDVAAE